MQILGVALVSLLGQAGTAPPPKTAAPPPTVAISDTTVGKGDPVATGDEVTVDYTGALTDGTVFDTSKKTGRQPFKFIVGVSQVIQGWHLGLVGMKLDGVRKLTIPGALAYGATGRPPTIPPNATLVFTIELHKVEHPASRLKINTTHPGEGAALAYGSLGFVKITGKHSDGTVFVSTNEEMPLGAPFEVGKFKGPAGFTLAVLGMKVGEKRTVIIPPDLAFGATGVPQLKIQPNESITLDLELVSIGAGGPSRSKDTRN